MIRRILVCAAIVVCPVAALAQTVVSVYTLKVFAPGATAPIQATTAPLTAATCNVVPLTGRSTVNPTLAQFDDAAHVGMACALPLAAFFGGLPIGAYRATMALTDNAGLTSPDSALSNPFERRLAPRAPVNLRVTAGG